MLARRRTGRRGDGVLILFISDAHQRSNQELDWLLGWLWRVASLRRPGCSDLRAYAGIYLSIIYLFIGHLISPVAAERQTEAKRRSEDKT